MQKGKLILLILILLFSSFAESKGITQYQLKEISFFSDKSLYQLKDEIHEYNSKSLNYTFQKYIYNTKKSFQSITETALLCNRNEPSSVIKPSLLKIYYKSNFSARKKSVKQKIDIKDFKSSPVGQVHKGIYHEKFVKHRKAAMLWGGGAVLGFSMGVIFKQVANNHYDDYQKAKSSDKADKLREKVKRNDIFSILTYSAGTILLVPTTYHIIKQEEFRKKMDVSARPVKGGMLFSFKYSF